MLSLNQATIKCISKNDNCWTSVMIILLASKVRSMRQLFRLKKNAFGFVSESIHIQFLGSRCAIHGTCATCWYHSSVVYKWPGISPCNILFSMSFIITQKLHSFLNNLYENMSIRGCIQKFTDWVDNEINNNDNKHSLSSNIKRYGAKTH
jgi:hypothetical protein